MEKFNSLLSDHSCVLTTPAPLDLPALQSTSPFLLRDLRQIGQRLGAVHGTVTASTASKHRAACDHALRTCATSPEVLRAKGLRRPLLGSTKR